MGACYSKYIQASHTGKSDALSSINRVKWFNSIHTEACGEIKVLVAVPLWCYMNTRTHREMGGWMDGKVNVWTDKYMQPLLKQKHIMCRSKTHKEAFVRPTLLSNWTFKSQIRYQLWSENISTRSLRLNGDFWDDLKNVSCFSLKGTLLKLFHHSTESKWRLLLKSLFLRFSHSDGSHLRVHKRSQHLKLQLKVRTSIKQTFLIKFNKNLMIWAAIHREVMPLWMITTVYTIIGEPSSFCFKM